MQVESSFCDNYIWQEGMGRFALKVKELEKVYLFASESQSDFTESYTNALELKIQRLSTKYLLSMSTPSKS